MPAGRTPLFLARRSYRRRRVMDAARMLPVLGGFLVALPILWRPAETPGGETADGVVYLFTVWALLIAAAAVLARRLAPALDDEAGEDPGAGGIFVQPGPPLGPPPGPGPERR